MPKRPIATHLRYIWDKVPFSKPHRSQHPIIMVVNNESNNNTNVYHFNCYSITGIDKECLVMYDYKQLVPIPALKLKKRTFRMAKLMFGRKEKIVLLTAVAILLLAASAYMGERFQPYKIVENISSYTAKQFATVNTYKVVKKIGSYTVKQITTADTHKVTPTAVRHTKYVVQKGDTIWSISKKYKVKPELLKFANYIGSNSKITVGQKLTIPKRS